MSKTYSKRTTLNRKHGPLFHGCSPLCVAAVTMLEPQQHTLHTTKNFAFSMRVRAQVACDCMQVHASLPAFACNCDGVPRETKREWPVGDYSVISAVVHDRTGLVCMRHRRPS